MESFLKFKIATNRRTGVLQSAAGLAQRFLNAYHYTGEYAFASNGEKFAIEQFARIQGPQAIIWDVGAHLGEYAMEAHRTMPEARIVSFEIVPEIAEQMQRKLSGDWLELKQIGLSDAIGEIDVAWNKNQDTTNSINLFAYEHIDRSNIEMRRCPITTIDHLVAAGETPPDLLKIDVEGHEKAVLFGARQLLSGGQAPVMIQFEYGGTWIPSAATLYSVQQYLEGFGYSVGRLYPGHVEFKRYSWQDEHYRMGNIIACRNEALRALLSA
jgi:FkbM family methyltransferase